MRNTQEDLDRLDYLSGALLVRIMTDAGEPKYLMARKRFGEPGGRRLGHDRIVLAPDTSNGFVASAARRGGPRSPGSTDQKLELMTTNRRMRSGSSIDIGSANGPPSR